MHRRDPDSWELLRGRFPFARNVDSGPETGHADGPEEIGSRSTKMFIRRIYSIEQRRLPPPRSLVTFFSCAEIVTINFGSEVRLDHPPFVPPECYTGGFV